jgi:hypothetical protein
MASYSVIDRQVLGAAASSITFTSIPGTYTDLRLVIQATGTTSSQQQVWFQLNSDTGNNYAVQHLESTGTAVSASINYTSQNIGRLGYNCGPSNTDIWSCVADFVGYSQANFFKPIFNREGNASVITGAHMNVWNSRTAITQIYLYPSSGNWGVGSSFTLYGITASGSPKATGGTITTDGVYYYHTFGSTSAFVPNTSITADILQVAGGGGGGECTSGYTNRAAGGGGAGGLLGYTSQALTATSYTITVGAGGSGGLTSGSVAPTAGSNSQFAALTASVGGGYGGVPGVANAGNGGSGGGGADNNSNGTGTVGQGNNGAQGNNGTGGNYSAGGGGGAGGVGSLGSGTVGGAGGVGSSSYNSWGVATKTGQLISSTYYYATGGTGGGGTGGTGPAGPIASGNGGGGAYSVVNGSNGGSGIVIVRYPVG